MSHLIHFVFQFFNKRPWSFSAILFILLSLGIFLSSKLTVDQDITSFFPDSKEADQFNQFIAFSKNQDQLIFILSDSQANTTSLIEKINELQPQLDQMLVPFVLEWKYKSDESMQMELFDSITSHLPIYLNEKEVASISNKLKAESLHHHFQNLKQQIFSPESEAAKWLIQHDPLGFSTPVFRSLQQLQLDTNYIVEDEYFFSADRKHLFAFVRLDYARITMDEQKSIMNGIRKLQATNDFSVFGALPVAEGNARQVDMDMRWTMSLFVVASLFVLFLYFRQWAIPLIIFIPVIFGFLFALSMVYLFKAKISMLAIACGSMILGIAVNYALHIMTHFKKVQDIKCLINELSAPLLLGSATTILAFFGLHWTRMPLLREIGFFGGNCLLGAAISSLTILPVILPRIKFKKEEDQSESLFKQLSTVFRNKWLFTLILLLTIMLAWKVDSVKFDADLGSLNYMDKSLAKTEKFLEAQQNASLSALYLLGNGKDLQNALQDLENKQHISTTDEASLLIAKTTPVNRFMISDSLQALRLHTWNSTYGSLNEDSLKKSINIIAGQYGFEKLIADKIVFMLKNKYTAYQTDDGNIFYTTFFKPFVLQNEDGFTIIQRIQSKPEKRQELNQYFDNQDVAYFERQQMINNVLEWVQKDFQFVLTFTAILVFVILLLNYGRIELTIISFAPMGLSWVWVLGLMSWWDIPFNMINVMMSTFIFGLGDDFSIFTMDRLIRKHKYGKVESDISSDSISLSALITIFGLGVLIFARHPALRSIGSIAVFGIIAVYFMSQIVQPALFNYIITRRTDRAKIPMTIWGMFMTFLTFGYFTLSSLFLGIVGWLLRLIPFAKARIRLLYHYAICYAIRFLIWMAVVLKVQWINRPKNLFDEPKVIICNHSSFLDILFMTMMHPRLILLTNKWVWNSPIFGAVVRFAGYYPVAEGAEDSLEFLQRMVAEGYSIVVFPEGTRSPDGILRRFHKGAFYIAEKLQLAIQPIVIIGASDSIPKTDIYLNRQNIDIYFLDEIKCSDQNLETDYSQQAKQISNKYKEAWLSCKQKSEDVHYFANKLVSSYTYKGPVLEWYTRIKLMLENNYEEYDRLISKDAKILDIGCGYGYLSHLLAWTGPHRKIYALDTDREKILVAQAIVQNKKHLHFFCEDATQFSLPDIDTVLLSDVLHYLSPGEQLQLLEDCYNKIPAGGKILIREGNAEDISKQKFTKFTEWLSTNVFRFNNNTGTLHFIRASDLIEFFESRSAEILIRKDSKVTSNTLYIITK